MNPKLLRKMIRNPRVTGKGMVYFPTGMHKHKEIPLGASIETMSLVKSDGTIEIEYRNTTFLVFKGDLCER